MLAKRVIPCMDVKDGRVVKGVNFVNLRDAGDPIELAQRYDLKDSGAEITLDKAGKSMTVAAPADFVAKQVIDVIGSKLVRRGIDLAVQGGGIECGNLNLALIQGVEAVFVIVAAALALFAVFPQHLPAVDGNAARR